IHEVFKRRGIHMLDAPVSGGPRGAESRRLALWVGGDEDVFKRYRPVLDAIGDQPYYVGPIGAGSVAKLVHNCAGYIVQTALAEVTEALNRGWAERDSRVAMLLQEERAGVEIRVPEAAIREALADDKSPPR